MARPRRHRFRLEPLRQAGEEGAARAELRVADADAGAVADLVVLVEQVERRRTAIPDPCTSRYRSAERC